MLQFTLTALDTTGIQRYIFGSNRLRENVGASELVHQATHEWVRESLPANNLLDNGLQDERRIENDGSLAAEVIVQGGGNVLILFRTLAEAKLAVGKLTRRILLDAPGLELAAAHVEFDWNTEGIGGPDGVHERLFGKLAQAKQQRRISAPLPGLGVTLECGATGEPATAMLRIDERRVPVSTEIVAKHRDSLQTSATTRLQATLHIPEQYTITNDFDQLGGTKNDVNYIAVVHADGNGIGQRFTKLVERYTAPNENRICLDELRKLSRAVDQAGQRALQRTVARLTDSFRTNDSQEAQRFLQDLSRGEQITLPFRPIVYGGDDVTFVCDGRLGVSLASAYLQEWEQASEANALIGKSTACAGVAIVKLHYPFARAYALSEALCQNAKQQLRTKGRSESGLDWHFAMSGIGGSISEIRQREYTPANGKGSLCMRPVVLNGNGLVQNWQTWNTFHTISQKLKSTEWSDRRNKVKQLREVLREGSPAVRNFRSAYNLPDLPDFQGSSEDIRKQGWDGNHCVYFDAIEAIDFMLLDLPESEAAHD